MRKISILILIVVLVVPAIFPAFAESLEELKRQQEHNNNKIVTTRKQLTEAKTAKQETAADIERLDKAIDKTQNEISSLAENIKKLDGDIKDSEADIKDREDAYARRKELFKKRLKTMYMHSRISYLDVIFEAKSFNDLVSRIKLVGFIFKFDRDLMSDINKQKNEIASKKAKLEEHKVHRESDRKKKVARAQDLDVSRSQKADYIRKLNSDIKRLEALEDDLLKSSERIGNAIKALLDKKRKYGKGSMIWPLPDVGIDHVSSRFGMRMHPILKKLKFHTGVDIWASRGSDIVAAKSGKVIVAAYEKGYGNYIVIDHGVKDGVSISTLYAHCARFLVGVGDEVTAGQVIAKVGSTGYATGPHLHFEVRKDNEPVDPQGYLGY